MQEAKARGAVDHRQRRAVPSCAAAFPERRVMIPGRAKDIAIAQLLGEPFGVRKAIAGRASHRGVRAYGRRSRSRIELAPDRKRWLALRGVGGIVETEDA